MKNINPGLLFYDAETRSYRHYGNAGWDYVDYEKWIINQGLRQLKILDYDWFIYEGDEIVEWLESHYCKPISKYTWEFPDEHTLSFFLLKWHNKNVT